MRALRTLTILFLSTYSWAQEKKSTTRQRFEQAIAAYDAGKFAEALPLFDKTLQETPGNMDAYLLRAATREQLNDLAGANTDYSVYLEHYPDRADALYSIVWLRLNGLMHATNSARRICSSTRQVRGSKNSAGPCMVKL